MLTTAQAASRLNVPTRTIRYWCASGLLAGAQRYGRDWLIPETAIARFQKPKRGRPAKQQ